MKKMLVCEECTKDGCSIPNSWCYVCRDINLEPIIPMTDGEIETLYQLGLCDYRIHNGCIEFCDGVSCEIVIRLLARLKKEQDEKLKLLEFLEDFTACEPSWSDDRLDYEDLQIDKVTKEQAKEFIKNIKKI